MSKLAPTSSNLLANYFSLFLLERLSLKHRLFRNLKSGDFDAIHVCDQLGVYQAKKIIGGSATQHLFDALNDPADDPFYEGDDSDDLKKQIPTISRKLRAQFAKADEAISKLEVDQWADHLPMAMGQNFRALLKIIPLSQSEQKLLLFSYLMHYDATLNVCAKMVKGSSISQLHELLAAILRLDQESVRQTLLRQSMLIKGGLITFDIGSMYDFTDAIRPLNDGFLRNFVEDHTAHNDLFRTEWRVAPKGSLTWANYQHLEPLLSGLKAYLAAITKQPGVGGNVLIYGPPGTGKTELARLLGEQLGVLVSEVSCENSEGRSVTPLGRINSLKAAQTILKAQRSLLVFDEVEDVFQEDPEPVFLKKKEKGKISKAWINRVLEEATVPTIWISNSTYSMDRAYIRRFDFVLNLPVPPTTVREAQIKALVGERVSELTVRAIASHPNVSPAMLSRTAKVLTTIGDQVTDPSTLCQGIIDQSLNAQYFDKTPSVSRMRVADRYEPQFVNCPTALDRLAQGLRARPCGRVLIYGPPGTGKTAFGHWLARELGFTLLIKKASDLLGMYVGQTEQNIAEAFEQANGQRCILMIDEIDSFMGPRGSANHSWEVSMVNEMLTQMESFDGLFLASTNFNDNLDHAAFRRFDLKLHFDYLTTQQLHQLVIRELQSVLQDQDSEQLISGIKHELSGHLKCTAGDIAAVVRQHRFNPVTSVADFACRLKADLALRHKESRPMGFLN
ncbi:MAG: AAA family ATPase [Limnobacter sp.]|uniref:AAA family ATPase n=1 Tax=Limnobacter sp. TaxID=2003368 RepID=UPI00391883BF